MRAFYILTRQKTSIKMSVWHELLAELNICCPFSRKVFNKTYDGQLLDFVSNASSKALNFSNTFILLKILNACVRYFLFFSANDSSSKTMKNIFYFIYKTLFVLKIFNFLKFFPFLSALSRFKRTNESRIIYDVMNWLA